MSKRALVPLFPGEIKLDLNTSFVRGWVTDSVTWPSGFPLTEDMVKESKISFSIDNLCLWVLVIIQEVDTHGQSKTDHEGGKTSSVSGAGPGRP